jgi:hypothetical protein
MLCYCLLEVYVPVLCSEGLVETVLGCICIWKRQEEGWGVIRCREVCMLREG